MAINRRFFFDSVRLRLFDGAMKASQVQGLTAILNKWEAEAAALDDRWLAYMLATAHHETGRTMQPVRETFAASDAQAISRLNAAYASGVLTWVAKPYWQRDADGKSWLGRGFVQLTHKANYRKLSDQTGIDLTTDPTAAMSLDAALAVMFVGMRRGSFTTHKLADFFSGATEKWKDARRIINGTERAELVASYAIKYYGAISYTT